MVCAGRESGEGQSDEDDVFVGHGSALFWGVDRKA